MNNGEKLTISVPEEISKRAKSLGINVAEVALASIERQIKLKEEAEKLKQGYIEMGEINLGLAELSLEAENDALLKTEQYLTECE